MKLREFMLNESSLSRVYSHNKEHDCAAMTAFRTARDCGTGEIYAKKEKMQRNRSLSAKLLKLGYTVISINGVYPEGGKKTTENSFFIVDIKDSGNIEEDIFKLGAEFEQDSVLIIPKGTIDGNGQAFLLGTNRCENGYPGWKKKEYFDKSSMGKESPIYTSYVNGRPFIFESIDNIDQLYRPENGMGLWAMSIEANKHWTEIEIKGEE